jgi:hypothetical protein
MPENNASTTANPYTAEWRKKTLAALREPFDPDDINWKPQTVDYKKKKAMAVASADIRAYMDRLNEVVGPESWTQSFQLTVTPYKRIIRAKLDYKEKDANGISRSWSRRGSSTAIKSSSWRRSISKV